jgi:hypothetical protein
LPANVHTSERRKGEESDAKPKKKMDTKIAGMREQENSRNKESTKLIKRARSSTLQVKRRTPESKIKAKKR